MTLRDIIAITMAPFFFAGLVWMLPKVWRNERGLHTDTPPRTWPWSMAFWHALCRVWFPLGISFLIIIPAAVATEFVTDGPLLAVCNILLGVGGAIWIFITPTVWLWNRPHFMLPSHLRALPGWLAERRGAPVPPVPEPAKPPRWHLAPR